MSDLQSRIAALSPDQRARFESRITSLSSGRSPATPDRISPRDRTRPTPLSFAQQREWAVEQFRPANNVIAALRFDGDLNLELVGRVLTEISARHEVLRSTIEMVDRQPTQVVHPPTEVPVTVEDLSGLDPGRQSAAIRQRCDAEVTRPFPPDHAQRLRVTALMLDPTSCVLVLTVDHTVTDSWSMLILVREVDALYVALSTGTDSGLPPLPIQYGDFAVWERGWLDEDRMAAELAHWRQVLADAPPRLALPADRPSAVRRTSAGDHYALALPREPTEALHRFAGRQGVSLSMLLLTACSVVMHRYTYQDDLVFGTAVSGRWRAETEHLIGCFSNILPLRVRLSSAQTLGDVLAEARNVVSTAFDHESIPFDRLIEDLAPQEAARSPLIQMMINVLVSASTGPRPVETVELPGLRVSSVAADPGPIPIDIILSVKPSPDSLQFDWHYSTDAFDRVTIERLAAQVPHVLHQLVSDPDRKIGDVTFLDVAFDVDERAGGQRARPAAPDTTFVEAFERQVGRAPDSPAVIGDQVRISFDELNRRANRLAHQLRAAGVGAETTVGVLVDQSPALAVGILGILKAGGAFLPLDPTYPVDRIRYLLADAGTPVLVTTERRAALAADAGPLRVVLLDGPDHQTGHPDHNPGDPPGPTAKAYVIYTSGSTGHPKGVVIEHLSLQTFAREVAECLQLGAGDRFLQFASPGFDVVVEELFPIWLAGGAVVFPPDRAAGAALDLADLAEVVEQSHVTVMELPATYWHEWVRGLDRAGGKPPSPLRLMIVGTERLLPERLAAWQRFDVPLMHVYGITETTVSSTFFRLPPKASTGDLEHLPIGTELPSAELHILDPELRTVPAGGIGELYIGGISVGRGYHGRPGLTAQRFIASPVPGRPGDRVYRTGDLVRRRADGNVEFLARVDSQMKIRGYRIEPAEIESAICRHPHIAQAVVSVYEPHPGDRRLVAHVVTHDGDDTSPQELRRYLASVLPPYLVPSAYVRVEAIPLTPNGKVDADRLPPPGSERAGSEGPAPVEDEAPPQSPMARRLAEIIAGVLGVDAVGATDDFFDLGGDSILAIMVVSKAEEEGINLSPLDIFQHRTVEQLARTVSVTEAPGLISPRPPDAEPVLSFDQERFWLENQLVPGAAYNVGWQQLLVGPLDLAVVEASVRALLNRQASLRTRFPTVDGRPIQVVDELDENWRLWVEDYSSFADGAERARQLLADQVNTGFDLANGPLVRCLVVKLRENEHLISMISHHIVADVVSVGLFVREMGALYQAGGDLARAGLPELGIQYLDYAVWQRERLSGPELDRQVEYWREHLAGAPRALTMPMTRHLPSASRGGRASGVMSAADTAALKELGRTNDVTAFMVTLAAFATVLARWAGQRDVVIGVSISNRTNSTIDHLIGSFINTVPMRVDLSGEPTFAELLDRVREVALGGYAHADAPLDVIIKQLKLTRDPRRTPVFQVMLNVVDVPRIERFGDIVMAPVETPALQPSFDIVLTTNEIQGQLEYQLDYDAGRFPVDLMGILCTHIGRFLAAAVADPTRSVLDYALEEAPEGAAALPVGPATDWAVERFGFGPDDRFAVLSPSPEQLAAATSSARYAGGTLVTTGRPPNHELGALVDWLNATGTTVVYANPPLLRAIARAAPLRTLRYVFVENTGSLTAHDANAVRGLSARCRLVATYRTGADGRPLAAYELPDDWDLETAPLRIPLGTDVPGNDLTLRHPSGQPAAVGEVAEICCGPRRTGDLGRRWPDGSLEYIGSVTPAARPYDDTAAARPYEELESR